MQATPPTEVLRVELQPAMEMDANAFELVFKKKKKQQNKRQQQGNLPFVINQETVTPWQP